MEADVSLFDQFFSGIVSRDIAIDKILDEYYKERIKEIEKKFSNLSLKERIKKIVEESPP